MNESVLHLRQYPEKEEIAYPKPGTPNPKVRLIVPSVNYLMEWPCFVCVWRNLLMCLVHLIKVGLTVMKLPKGPRVAITPPKELTGQVKKCNLPLFSCSRTLFLFVVLQEPLLTNFLWMSDDVLVVNWMNRIQNHSIHLRSSLQCSCSIPHLINVFQHYLG